MELAWQQAVAGEPRTWSRCGIDREGLVITRTADSTLNIDPASSRDGADDTEHIATLLPHGAGDVRSTVLVLPSPSRASGEAPLLLNGLPPLAVTELSDGAEISLGVQSFYYDATTTSMEPEIFDAAEDEDCARCKRVLKKGAAIRRCGACASAHHEGPSADPELGDLCCASYDAKCGRCGTLWNTTATEDVFDGA